MSHWIPLASAPCCDVTAGTFNMPQAWVAAAAYQAVTLLRLLPHLLPSLLHHFLVCCPQRVRMLESTLQLLRLSPLLLFSIYAIILPLLVFLFWSSEGARHA